MYYIKKVLEVSSAHKLCLDYSSKCSNVHGHNWIITVECCSKELNQNGMVIDFSTIKEVVMKLDHNYLNEFIPINPTAENIAKFICDEIPQAYRVTVQESIGNVAIYCDCEEGVYDKNISN